jgi:putative PIG3 family NAD(P)H quinone oxidoreductase
MRAINIAESGGPGVLRVVDLPTPSPQAEEVLIEVAAAGVNRPDVLQRQGLYAVPPDASPLPGLEVAGTVRAIGVDVDRWRPGDAVMALTHGGGYAEYCVAHQGHCLAIPQSLDFVEAAAVPETFFTVWYNVFMRAHLEAGESILVHGGSSGIGTTAIQLAHARGSRVIVTAGSEDKCRFCENLGADHAINYRDDDWQARVKEITSGAGVDVILDMVAGPYAQQNLDSLAQDGRYVIIAFLGGARAELNLRAILAKRLTVTGSTLRPQTIAEKSAIARGVEADVLPLLAERTVRPVIFETFPLEKAPAAHELMESSRHMGKIVLTVAPNAA